jgi:hypothetical protein
MEAPLTTSARVPGKYGRLSARFPAGLRDLTHYAAGSLPKAPASVAVPDVAFPIDGNDQWGDCGVAGAAHGFQAAAADTGEAEAFPTADEVVSYYLQYTGGQDSGVVLSDFLAYVKQNGFYGHTVAAYAPVNVSDIPTLQFAVNAYDFAYTGITVTRAMEQAFGSGQPWTLGTAQGEPVGGHCVPIVGYDSTYLYCVTWGAVQPIAYSAWAHIASEAWAVITGEAVSAGTDGHGINLAALQADLGKLDTPAPVPVQPGNPGLLAELASLIREAEVSTETGFADVVRWVRDHGL